MPMYEPKEWEQVMTNEQFSATLTEFGRACVTNDGGRLLALQSALMIDYRTLYERLSDAPEEELADVQE